MIIKFIDRIILDEEKDECVNVDELKAHALIMHDMYDAQIVSVVKAAITSVENDTNVKLRRVTVQETFAPKNGDTAYLRDGQVKVDYVTVDGSQEQLQRNVHYKVSNNRLDFIDVPLDSVVVVRYIAGYECSKVPADIRYSVLMRAAAMFQTRSDLTSENLKLTARCSDNLIARYKQLRR